MPLTDRSVKPAQFDRTNASGYWAHAMNSEDNSKLRAGDTVRILESIYSNAASGSVGIVDCALGEGYGVTLTGDFFIAGVVPLHRWEIRTIWFHAGVLEKVLPGETSESPTMPPVCSIGEQQLGANQVCPACDSAFVRV